MFHTNHTSFIYLILNFKVAVAKHFAKYSARPSSISQIPFFIEKAVRASTYGRPGSVYIDLAAEMVNGTVDSNQVG